MEIPVHEAVNYILLWEQLQQLLLILDDTPGTKDDLRWPQGLERVIEVFFLLLVLFEVALEILDLEKYH